VRYKYATLDTIIKTVKLQSHSHMGACLLTQRETGIASARVTSFLRVFPAPSGSQLWLWHASASWLQSHLSMGVIATKGQDEALYKHYSFSSCNPMSIWESLLPTELYRLRVSWKMSTSCNPMVIWELFLR